MQTNFKKLIQVYMYSVNVDIKQLSELLAMSDKHIDTIVIHSKDRLILIFPKIKTQA